MKYFNLLKLKKKFCVAMKRKENDSNVFSPIPTKIKAYNDVLSEHFNFVVNVKSTNISQKY